MRENPDLSTPKKKKNPKNEIIFQIYIPIAIVLIALVVLSVMILMLPQGTPDIGHWANISVILLSIPTLLFLLIGVVLLLLLIYGQSKLIRWLPIQIKKLYALILQASAVVWRFSSKLSEPVLAVNSRWYAFRRLFRKEKS